MVTRVAFENKKQNRVVWVDGKPVRFKNGVATVQDDSIAKKLAKKKEYEIISTDNKTKVNNSNDKHELERLNGVGKATAEKLENAGFTINNIREANFDNLAEAGIDTAIINKILNIFNKPEDESEDEPNNEDEGNPSEKK